MADAEQLRDLIKKILAEKKCDGSEVKVVKFDSGGANYTSALFRVTVSLPKDDDLHLFAKVAAFGESMREKINADWMYSTEQFVYTKLANIYEDLQLRHGVENEHRYVFPKFFGLSSEHGNETVVTEDLAAAGYVCYDRFRPMDWEYAAVSMETLAKFHALSFAYEKEHPEEFQKIAKDMQYKIGSEENKSLESFWVQLVEGSLAVIREENKDRVRKIVYDENVMKNYNKPIDKIVLAHGDYRLSNLLFKKQDGRLQVVPVDYQLVHSGCPLNDVLYFITVGSDQQFRAKHFHQLIDYYYEQLAMALERFSLDIVDVYPREVFNKELKEKLPHMLLLGVMILPAVTVEADAAPKMGNEIDVSTFIFKTNKLYAERFNGIIDDCIEWGVI
ncbi:unnamed protein product [Parnassius apollo]|uniref:(apollo) hypothetical protein n=1 Tax=Parnassius apollo TaxID=110799 RepID=A0A8S3XH08_PARAO|nr:unnamed protein product [Parnassius apollo]